MRRIHLYIVTNKNMEKIPRTPPNPTAKKVLGPFNTTFLEPSQLAGRVRAILLSDALIDDWQAETKAFGYNALDRVPVHSICNLPASVGLLPKRGSGTLIFKSTICSNKHCSHVINNSAVFRLHVHSSLSPQFCKQ